MQACDTVFDSPDTAQDYNYTKRNYSHGHGYNCEKNNDL